MKGHRHRGAFRSELGCTATGAEVADREVIEIVPIICFARVLSTVRVYKKGQEIG